ncbi:MAG: hypothetical protein HY863_16835 [Chloroflexi bacterium]|nr:hypothetical protein [Chloroflexota bacterium]
MTRNAIYASIFIGTVALAVGLALQEHLVPAIGVGLLGAAWTITYRRNMFWVASPAFALFTIISAVSIWAGVSSWLALACVISSLIAWDLTMFIQRLQATNESSPRVVRTHFLQLGFIAGLSVLGVLATTLIRISLTFGGAAILAMLGIWGISALVYRLRRHEDDIDV